MLNETQFDEKNYLETIKKKIELELEHMSGRVNRYAQDIREQKAYMWEAKAEMDHVEKISARQSAEQTMRSGEVALAVREQLRKLLGSPYFGRLDFLRDGDPGAGDDALPVYVGIHSFADQEDGRNLIFDWRAPISSMFYDFELGRAQYKAPSGVVRGDIRLKRQYRIRHGKLEFMLESGLSILDDVLQAELSRTSDDRMKNIVATIQRDQNAIIRNEDAEVLIIQGVAGSGKTSIALHRIAFLLYRFKDELSSKDILIISPNKVFADFISNVLPELGEEQIAEMEMESLADEVFGRRYPFQTQLEQAAILLEGRDTNLGQRIQAKASMEFLRKLDEYAQHVENSRFFPVDLPVRNHVVPADFLEQAYWRRMDVPLPTRLSWVSECAEQEAWSRRRFELSGQEKASLRSAVRKMGKAKTLRALYREFFSWLGEPSLFKTAGGSKLEHSDVFPLIYLKLRLERDVAPLPGVKHLVVDEMQDYTPVQYAVLGHLFPCNKTILGDVNQSLNAWAASDSEAISQVLPGSECVRLCKSYRSSYEITCFAQGISPSAELIAIERHGPKPRVVAFREQAQETRHVLREIAAFSQGNFQTMGIICKTQKQAEELHEAIQDSAAEVSLLTARSTSFLRGVVICSVHLAKGLEFDQVLVPQATQRNYDTALERNLLYVACTRAMHELVVSHVGPLTRLIADETLYEFVDESGLPRRGRSSK